MAKWRIGTTVRISDIRKDGLLARVGIDERTVQEYKAAMERGEHFPPIVVYKDGEGVFWLADGFHRLEAIMRSGKRFVSAQIERGGYANALRYALRANTRHGLRSSEGDLRRALEMALANRRELLGTDNPTARMLALACDAPLAMAAEALERANGNWRW